MVKVKLKEWAL
jgi:hypothetical protein